MKTYVTIDNLEKHYADIDDAVQAAEEMGLETIVIYVSDESGEILYSQNCERDPRTREFVYYAWGIIGYTYYEDSDCIECTEILAEGINSKEEALEKAKEIQDQFISYDVVKAESYSQTISENIGDVCEAITIYKQGK